PTPKPLRFFRLPRDDDQHPATTIVLYQSRRGKPCLVKPVEASYENGLLKPAKPLPLAEGEHVKLIVVRQPDPKRWDLTRIASAADDEDGALAEAGLDEWAAELDAEDSR